MVALLLLAAPCALAQLINPDRPLLRATRGALVVAAAAVAVLLSASAIEAWTRVLVPSGFFLGAVALTWVAWTSSGSRLATGLAGGGALCNLIPISIYGAMPVVLRSRQVISDQPIVESGLVSAKHRELVLDSPGDYVLGAFGDWIPVPRLGAVISIGDLILMAALITIAVVGRRQPADDAAGAVDLQHEVVGEPSLVE